MNKGIIILEYIEKVLADHGSIYNNYLEKGTIMLTLLEFLFNKSETSFKECSPNDKDRITYLLSICYKVIFYFHTKSIYIYLNFLVLW